MTLISAGLGYERQSMENKGQGCRKSIQPVGSKTVGSENLRASPQTPSVPTQHILQVIYFSELHDKCLFL